MMPVECDFRRTKADRFIDGEVANESLPSPREECCLWEENDVGKEKYPKL